MMKASPASSPEPDCPRSIGAAGSIGKALCLLVLGACEQPPPAAIVTEPAPDRGASAALASAAVAAPKDTLRDAAPSPSRLDALRGVDCRVMSVRGLARHSSGEPITAREKVPEAGWFELEPGARVVVKHILTAREWTLEGPARASFCPMGREEVILGIGTLRSEMGPGARPGAEVNVGTAFGTVRYGDARAELVVSESELRLASLAGEASLVPALATAQSKAEPALRAPRSGQLQRNERQRLGVAQATALCSDAASRAAALGAALLEPAQTALGRRTAEHVLARRQARMSCVNAAAAALAQLRGEKLDARLREIVGHDRVWQSVPDTVR
jgi:hypothetical protein